MEAQNPIDHIIEIKAQLGAVRQALTTAEKERSDAKLSNRETHEAITKLTERMAAMPDDQHREHHDFIKTLVEEKKQSQQLKEAVIQKIAVGGVWALIAGIGTLVWHGLKTKSGTGP